MATTATGVATATTAATAAAVTASSASPDGVLGVLQAVNKLPTPPARGAAAATAAEPTAEGGADDAPCFGAWDTRVLAMIGEELTVALQRLEHEEALVAELREQAHDEGADAEKQAERLGAARREACAAEARLLSAERQVAVLGRAARVASGDE